MRTKSFEPSGEGEGLDPSSILLLTVPRRYFFCGSSMLHVAMQSSIQDQISSDFQVSSLI